MIVMRGNDFEMQSLVIKENSESTYGNEYY